MESSNGLSVGQDISSSPNLTSSAVSSVETPSASHEVVNERSFRQSEVNELIGREKARAAERAVEEYKRKIQSEQQPSYQNQQNFAQPSNSMSNEERIRKIVAEETARQHEARLSEYQKKQQQETVNRIVASYQSKITSGKEKYKDFDAVTGDLEMGAYPFMVETLSDYIDNAADVLYEFGKDRMKLFNLEQMLQNPNTRSEGLRQCQRLSQSIKEKQTVAKVRTPNEPLSQLQSSSYGISNDGDLPSVRDLRKLFAG